MNKLDAVHREILTLRNILNKLYDEIAQALGIQEGTVKSRIARARGNLRVVTAGASPEFPLNAVPSEWFERVRAVSPLQVVTRVGC
jgi:RNA polymerase sigma-70 factor, ECF subfamily